VVVGAGMSYTQWAVGYSGADRSTGPAHAVYFATYEAVKNAMGGNEGLKHEHHPLAAGKTSPALFSIGPRLLIFCSRQRRLRNDRERCAHEPL
jgi:hypothetical protein